MNFLFATECYSASPSYHPWFNHDNVPRFLRIKVPRRVIFSVTVCFTQQIVAVMFSGVTLKCSAP